MLIAGVHLTRSLHVYKAQTKNNVLIFIYRRNKKTVRAMMISENTKYVHLFNSLVKKALFIPMVDSPELNIVKFLVLKISYIASLQ